MRDKLGNELKVGDNVLAVTRAGYLQEAVIINIIPHGVNNSVARVQYISNRIGMRRYSHHLIKI